MVTISSAPPAVALAGCPVVWQATSNNYKAAATAAVFIIAYSISGGGDDVTITLANGTRVVLSFDSLTGFLAAAQANQYLADNYTITSEDGFHTFTAKTTGAGLSLASATKVSTSSLLTIYSNTPGTNPQYHNFFRLKCSIYRVLSNGSQTLIGQDSIAPDAEGHCKFDIMQWFANETFSRLDLAPAALIAEQTGMLLKYATVFEETAIDPDFSADAPTNGSNAPTYVMWGGIGHVLQAQYNASATSWYTEYASATYKQFLSNHMGAKAVATDQTEQLFFLNLTAGTLSLQCTLTCTDGTTANHQLASITAAAPAVYAMQVGYTQAGLAALAPVGKTIESYQVWAQLGATRVSNIRTYTIDVQYYQQTRYIYYVNALGAWETIRITGETTDRADFSRTTALFSLQTNYNLQTQAEKTETTLRRATEAATGWLTSEQKQLAAELMLTRRAFEQRTPQGIAIPITITTEQTTDTSTEYLKAETISYRYAFADRFISPEALVALEESGYFDDYFDVYFE